MPRHAMASRTSTYWDLIEAKVEDAENQANNIENPCSTIAYLHILMGSTCGEDISAAAPVAVLCSTTLWTRLSLCAYTPNALICANKTNGKT